MALVEGARARQVDIPAQATRSRPARTALVLCALLAVAGCKGGGSAGIIGTAPPAPVNPGVLSAAYVTSFAPFEAAAAFLRNSTARYTVQLGNWASVGLANLSSYPLASSRVEYAHAAGLTGRGQVVSVVDGGFLQTHDVLQGKSIYTPGPLPVDDHGTQVASVVAGNSGQMIGIAPGASLALGEFTTVSTLATATREALRLGAVAQNNSWGFTNMPVDGNSFQSIFSSTDGADYLAALDAYAARGVVVFAISNGRNDTTSGIMEALPKLRPSLEAGWLAVGNGAPVFDSQRVTSATRMSAGCLDAARWCLFAEGRWSAAALATGNSDYGEAIGSSFAAPQVAGALALLAEAFPTLSPHELRVRLLASADNSFFVPTGQVELATGFFHGYNQEFGHGFLDIRAALLPIGTTTMALANGTQVNAQQPVVVTGAALGDAVARSLGKVDVAITDALSGQFRMPGQFLSAGAAPRPLGDATLARALQADLAALRTNRVDPLANPFQAFDGQSIDLRAPDGVSGASVLLPVPGSGDETYGVNMKTALLNGPTRLEIGLKVARDGGGLLGFGGDRDAASDLVSLQLGVSQDFGTGGFVALSGEAGLADLGSAPGVTDVSSAGFNSFSLEFGGREVFARGDRLAFGVSTPIAVTSGRAEMVLPVSRATGVSAFEPVAIDLAPSDRQIDFSVSYQTPVAPGLELMAKLVQSENYGNRAGESDTAGVLALQYSF